MKKAGNSKALLERLLFSSSPSNLLQEELFLLDITTRGNLLNDFLDTYNQELDDFKKRLAKKVFSDMGTSNQQYGIFFNRNLQARYAFNKAFGKYERKQRRVIYTPAEEILLSRNTDLSSSPVPSEEQKPEYPIVAKYGIVDPMRPGLHNPLVVKYGLINGPHRRVSPLIPRHPGEDKTFKYAMLGKEEE